LNTIYYELCGSPTHSTIQFRSLDALANILDHSTFRVNETPQGFEGGQQGGGNFRGGKIGRRGIVSTTTVMNKGILQDIFHFHEDHGVHIV
jgi:hypothetical protein